MANYQVSITTLLEHSLIENLYLLIGFILVGSLLCFCLVLGAHMQQENRIKFRQLFQEKMEPLLLGVLFQNKEPHTVWDLVLKKDIPILMDLLLDFYQRLSGAPLEKLVTLAEPYFQIYLKQIKTKTPERRAQAYKVLSTFAPVDYAEILVKGLKDKSALVVHIVFQALTHPRIQGHHEAILESLPRLENFSADYLSSMLYRKGTELKSGLRSILASSEGSLSLRIIAVKTLTLLQDLEALEIACERLKHETEVDILIPTLGLIETIGTDQLSSVVLPLLKSESFEVRASALKTLSSFERDNYRDLYVHLLEDPSPWVAKQAALALLESGNQPLLYSLSKTEHVAAALAEQVLAGL